MKKEKNKIQNLLAQQLPLLKKKYPIERMALFGSVLRDDYDSDNSDIDILVELNGAVGWEFIDLYDDLVMLLGKKIDLVSRSGIKSRYWEQIKLDILYV